MNGIGNEMWVQGFSDGYAGIPHVDGKGEDYDDGYSRGYATSETESALQVTP
jgi:hypothetical protein